jgi:hypothetical protein
VPAPRLLQRTAQDKESNLAELALRLHPERTRNMDARLYVGRAEQRHDVLRATPAFTVQGLPTTASLKGERGAQSTGTVRRPSPGGWYQGGANTAAGRILPLDLDRRPTIVRRRSSAGKRGKDEGPGIERIKSPGHFSPQSWKVPERGQFTRSVFVFPCIPRMDSMDEAVGGMTARAPAPSQYLSTIGI